MVNRGQMSMPMSLGGAVRQNPLLLLIDGHAMIHRSFRAISVSRNLTVSSTGEDVTGVYGFASVFLRALNEWQPTHVAVTFDTPTPTFRHERFPDYKAQRPPTPPELRGQFGRVKELMTTFAVPVYELPGWEADDIIGTSVPTGGIRQRRNGDPHRRPGHFPVDHALSVRVDLASSERDRQNRGGGRTRRTVRRSDCRPATGLQSPGRRQVRQHPRRTRCGRQNRHHLAHLLPNAGRDLRTPRRDNSKTSPQQSR